MKTISRVLSAAIVLMTASAAQAQSSVTADATATIVAPIAISQTTAMNFGDVAVHASNNGTVVLATNGTRTPGGGVTLPNVVGTVAAAAFNVTGDGNRTYAITLPSGSVTLTHSGNVQTMTVNAFTSNPSGTGTLAGGSQTVNVGATLNVGGGQLAGVYTGTYSVMVNYN